MYSTEAEEFNDLVRMQKLMEERLKSLEKQEGGTHYKNMAIQPLEFCAKNMTEEEIKGVVKKDVQKYIWREKDGVNIDWGKAKHIIEWGLEALGFAADNVKQPVCRWIFPRAKFADSADGETQLAKMATEAKEFIDSYNEWVKDGSVKNYLAMMDEATDFAHSRETYGRINGILEQYLRESENRVIEKNKIRGYYD